MYAWYDGLRKGRVFVTTGPLVELTVNSHPPGDDVAIPASGGAVDVEAHVRSILPLAQVLPVFNGNAIETLAPAGDRTRLDFRKSYPVHESGWFHLRAEGKPAERYPLDTGYLQGFTNPVWVTVGGRPVRNRAAAEYSLRWIDRLRQLAEGWPGWRSAKEKTHVFSQFDQARRVYQRLAAEADSVSSGTR